MKRWLIPFFLFSLVFAGDVGKSQKPAESAASLVPEFGSLPLTFIPNRGQAEGPALYYARTSGYTLWVTKGALVFESRQRTAPPFPPLALREVTRLEFAGADPNPVVVAQDPGPGVVNYFLGNDPARWKTGLPTSRAVLYRGLYKQIDLKIYGRAGAVEYDWVVNPGGNVRDIRFRIAGGAPASLDQDGNLVLRVHQGDWIQRRPTAYQVIDGKRSEVRAEFRTDPDGTFGIAVAPYDQAHPLTIDPVISMIFSTYLGGTKNEEGRDLAVSANGNVFVTGATDSSNFPAKSGVSLVPAGSQDVFVTKFAVSGRDLVYSTYLGGKGADRAYGIALKGGTAYITGSTNSKDFPTRNAYQGSAGGGGDAFVAVIHSSGGALVYSTYLGGKGTDSSQDIAVDTQGAAYVTGFTSSSDFPLASALDAKISGQDAFVTKLAPGGASLVYSTFLGGSGQDAGQAIALNAQGSAFVAGSTTSNNFPTAGAYDGTYNGSGDAFVARLSPSGWSLVYATYLGGSKADVAYGIALDKSGAAYVTGQTASSDFPVKNALDGVLDGKDAFVTKLSATGKKLVYSTFLGGAKDEAGLGIAVQTDGTASVTGLTQSSDFPTLASIDNTYNGNQDAFLTKLTSSGAKLVYSTFLGGTRKDTGYAVAVDAKKYSYVAGGTLSENFPVRAAFDTAWNGGQDAFVAKFADVDMMITNVRIRYFGVPDEVDVYGSNFGDHQGAKRLLCDGVPVPLDKTLWWSNTSLTFWTSGWLYPAIYWDHIYTFAIAEGTTIISNTHSQRMLMYIDSVSPNPAGTGATIDVYGWGFGAAQGSNVLKLSSSYTFSIVSWANTHIQATVPAAPTGSYYIYIQRGSDIISYQYPFSHS
jgi:hypothetical protein